VAVDEVAAAVVVVAAVEEEEWAGSLGRERNVSQRRSAGGTRGWQTAAGMMSTSGVGHKRRMSGKVRTRSDMPVDKAVGSEMKAAVEVEQVMAVRVEGVCSDNAMRSKWALWKTRRASVMGRQER
jgi:hypothetical protein